MDGARECTGIEKSDAGRGTESSAQCGIACRNRRMPAGYTGDWRTRMTARILDGRAMALELRAELRADVARYVTECGQAPGLVIVRVEGDPASGVYSKAILRI